MRYLMWKDDIIGEINSDKSVDLILDNISEHILIDRNPHWTAGQFCTFLEERIISRERRDIEKLLFRCGLSAYDVFSIAERTKAINAKDLFWVSDSGEEKFQDVITEVFRSVFLKNVDMTGTSIDTPEGCNIKRYGVYNGRYGIYKQRLHPLSKDVECEVAVYHLAARLGIPCCPAVRTDEDTVFSEFQYNFATEQIVHFRRLFQDVPRFGNELQNLLQVRPQYRHQIYQMIFLDFVTRQDDRHLSNIAVRVDTTGTRQESFYPLYDNGRSLFYQDTEETMRKACENPGLFSTTFGAEGNYFDHVCDIVREDPDRTGLIDTSVSEEEIYRILEGAGFREKHLEYSARFVSRALEVISAGNEENSHAGMDI